MSTTNLFVELLVIGVGASTWIGFALASVVGVPNADADLLKSYLFLFLGLSIIYVLGVISDRFADFLFDRLFSAPIRTRHFSDKRSYQDARRLVFRTSERLADQHEYGRIRIRVARGWAVNAALMAITWPILVSTRFADQSWSQAAFVSGTVGFAALAIACWWTWSQLCGTEYLKIKEHAEFLRAEIEMTEKPGRLAA